MKTLYLIRHAHAGNDPPGSSDHERRLTGRGNREAAQLADHLAALRIRPTLVLCSSAQRARETLAPIEKQLGQSTESVVTDDLYLASADRIEAIVAACDDAHAAVAVVAHLPGVGEFAQALANRGDAILRARLKASFPPAALVGLSLDVDHWSELAPNVGTLFEFTRPVDLD